MEAYKVPKQRARVTVAWPVGEPESGSVFLSACADRHQGAETVHDLFSRAEPFLPAILERRGFLLLRKDRLAWVRVEEPEAAEWHYLEQRAGAPRAVIRCRFADGSALEGEVWALTPPGEQRVVDVINRAEGFLHLQGDDGLYLINLRQVTAVEVVEEHRGEP